LALQATRRVGVEQEPLLFGLSADVAPIAGVSAAAERRVGEAADAGGGQPAGVDDSGSRVGTALGAAASAASTAAAAGASSAVAAADGTRSSTSAGSADSPTRATAPDLATPASCFGEEGAEYDGAGVALWGGSTVLPDAAACCAECAAHRRQHGGTGIDGGAGIDGTGCFWWVWCGAAGGCGGRQRGECWGKTRRTIPEGRDDAARLEALLPTVRSRGEGMLDSTNPPRFCIRGHLPTRYHDAMPHHQTPPSPPALFGSG
jgi:hypothetical protein